jgi:predicted PurR-regulated permease PerM
MVEIRVYMLKDHEKFIPAIGKFFKGERKVFVVDLLKDLNNNKNFTFSFEKFTNCWNKFFMIF